MPIATPEIYADMLDRAKAGRLRLPGDQRAPRRRRSTPRCAGFADAGSDGIIQVSTGGAEFASGHRASRTWSPARWRWPSSPTWSPRSTRSTSRCTPTTARRTSSTATSARCSRSRRSGSTPGRTPLFQSHMWDGSAVDAGGEPADRRGAARAGGQGPDRPRGRDRRRRRRGGRRRRRDEREALHDARATRCAPPRCSAPARRAATCWPRPSATCTASTSRATSSCARRSSKEIQDAVGARRSAESDKPFDLVFHGGSGSALEEIREARLLRRGQDERRHRHPVRVHPPDRRAHVHQLRRRAEDRRRGRQQEGLRPALLPQGRPRRAWPPASRRPARTCSRPARTPAAISVRR